MKPKKKRIISFTAKKVRGEDCIHFAKLWNKLKVKIEDVK